MNYKLLIVLLLGAMNGFSQRPFTMALPAVTYDRENMPVKMKLTQPLKQDSYYRLKEKGTNNTTLARVDGNCLVFIPSRPIPAGKKLIYSVSANTQKIADTITFQKTNSGVQALANGKPVFLYQTSTAMPPPDSPGYYQRSGFIHPLYTPEGAVLTDDFPEGHVHQHALFMAWANTQFRGKKIDFWNQHLQTGTVKHVKVVEMVSGGVYGRIKLLLQHVGIGSGAILEETWTITIYAVKNDFLFDIVSEQQNITTDTLYLRQYIYGGMAMRGSKSWNNHAKAYKGDSMQIETSEGRNRSAANHTHARFVTMHGKIGEKTGGVTVFDHPENFRYPQSIRVHPEMPYWVYTPVFDGNFEISPGKIYRSKYRYFVFDKLPNAKRLQGLEENWKSFGRQ